MTEAPPLEMADAPRSLVVDSADIVDAVDDVVDDAVDDVVAICGARFVDRIFGTVAEFLSPVDLVAFFLLLLRRLVQLLHFLSE